MRPERGSLYLIRQFIWVISSTWIWRWSLNDIQGSSFQLRAINYPTYGSLRYRNNFKQEAERETRHGIFHPLVREYSHSDNIITQSRFSFSIVFPSHPSLLLFFISFTSRFSLPNKIVGSVEFISISKYIP